MFKKILVVLCLIFVLVGQGALARSGCCSDHGGVCGCGCCDGSRLSSVCEQYYMDCEDIGFVENSKDDGWILALTYAVSVSLFLIFVKIRYKKKKSTN